MNQRVISLSGFPRAIMHLDADAFFTSVEQAINPRLRGKAIITGRERGIVACASYEAKAKGIKRGLPLFEAKKICPGLIILPNDYETYSLYSTRIFDIVRRYTPVVEEYSVDEAFADLTGLRRVRRCSYQQIALEIQKEIRQQMDLSVSVGLSLTRALAKLCSKFRKPRGFTAVEGRHIHLLLQRVQIGDVWGIGQNSEALLKKYGVHTALDFTRMPRPLVKKLLHKPGVTLWSELQGEPVTPLNTTQFSPKATVLKSKTFTPPSSDKPLVYAQLIQNTEQACAKLRRHKLRAQIMGVVLRDEHYQHRGLEMSLSRPTAMPLELMPLLRALFDRLFHDGCHYRSTMIVLAQLEAAGPQQRDLFEDPLRISHLEALTRSVDQINKRYGRFALRSGAALDLARKETVLRDIGPERMEVKRLFPGETAARHLNIPRLDINV